ncbi:hypothetical protein [Methylobacterium sp. Leaf86]|uniref:hypothetical protein n=1 Tax=Methylobacterium sp. Leaf86 TaxID=1736242 RepID=UPI000AA92868|nr:hypothetical protein [Methylobacterium sp. Leaf86]
MSHFSHLSIEAGSRVFQGVALVSAGVDAAFDAVRRQQERDRGAVETLAITHARTRQALVAARAETSAAREAAACLGRELVDANERADRAEAALARLIAALHA